MEDSMDKLRNYINALQQSKAESEEFEALFNFPFDDDGRTESLFTDNWNNDTLFTSEFDIKGENGMILYAYMDKQTADNLFQYQVGAWYNKTREYRNRNPLQVPLKLYETAEIARIMSTPQNTQLVAFTMNTGTGAVYSDFDIVLQINLKKSKIKVDDYKAQAVAWKEKKQYNGYDYIAYTIRDKNIVTSIQLQDTK